MSYAEMSTSVPWSLVQGGFKKTPRFNTLTQKSASGRRSSIALMPFPAWDFELDLYGVIGGEAIAGSVLQSFLGTFIASCGGGNFFLFTDPSDNTVTQDSGVMLNVSATASTPLAQTGDGVSTTFQLARSIGAGLDVLQNINGYELYVNGMPASATVSAKGVVTFASAPPANAMLSWDGGFKYLCQFSDDTLKNLARFSKNASGVLWQCSSIAFESVLV